MSTIILTLLGIIIVATVTFLFLLFRLPLEDADFWLKVMSGLLAAFTFLAGAAALVTGTIVGNRQSEKVLILEKETADAKRAYLELQERTQPRGFTEAHLEKMRKYLSDVRNVKKLRVEIVRAKHEFPISEISEVYASQLLNVIKGARFNVSIVEVSPSELPRNGIHAMLFSFGESNQAGYFFVAVQGALIDAGIRSGIQSESNAKFENEELVRIIVGLEP